MFSQADKDKFFEAIDSLKRYRRAELIDDEGNNLLDALYTDLLPNNQTLKTCLKNNTTFLIGRRGTGKSTIFLKIQQEIRKKENALSCYIDVKTIFESSKTEFVGTEHLGGLVSNEMLQKYLVERNFIKNILADLRKEIDKRSYSLIERVKRLFGTDRSTIVQEKLQQLHNTIENNEHLKQIEVPLFQQMSTRMKSAAENFDETTTGKTAQFIGKFGVKDNSIDAGLSGNRSIKNFQKDAAEMEKQFPEIFLKVFQVREVVTQLKDILSLLEIQNITILLDDFSEIDDQSIRTFVDVILAPLNNWSDEFIKFKIAAYPNRIYYGKIDTGKVDIIDLDFYNLYSEVDRSTMEDNAVAFTQRLIEKRIHYFTNQPVEYFFDTRRETMSNYYELIFQISMNVPRIIGYVLYYCGERTIASGQPITRASLEAASARYFEKNIEPFFDITTYSTMSFNEKISTLQLRELLQNFVDNLSSIKRRIYTGELSGREYGERNSPYTSHFHLNPTYEVFLKTLELNFFISKYNEMSSRDGIKQSIYCLNYGLCIRESLRWGKPKGSEYRKYFIARPFDFNNLIDDFLKNSKRLACTNCNASYPFEQLPFLQFNKMLCPECRSPVEVVSTSETIKERLEKIEQSKLLPGVELSILYELSKTEKALRPKEIAEELDCSYQLIGWKAKKLDEDKELIVRMDLENGKRVYSLTEKARSEYFDT